MTFYLKIKVKFNFRSFKTFSEELMDPTNPSSVRVINLKPNGSEIPVTDDNKLEYLDLLAQFRLSLRLKEQIEQVG